MLIEVVLIKKKRVSEIWIVANVLYVYASLCLLYSRGEKVRHLSLQEASVRIQPGLDFLASNQSLIREIFLQVAM